MNRRLHLWPAPFVFDPVDLTGEHGILGSIGRLLVRVVEPARQRETGPAVSIFNILPFRRRQTLDLDALYRKYAPMVARRVRRFVSHDDVEEVVHEVFLRV